MRRMKIEARNFGWGDLVGVIGAAAILLTCLPIRAVAQEKGQKTFSSAEDASQALVKAAQDNDEKTLIEIVGKSAKEIISSGDDKQDEQHRAHFVKRYEEMHRLFKEPDGTTTLYVGVDNWPPPRKSTLRCRMYMLRKSRAIRIRRMVSTGAVNRRARSGQRLRLQIPQAKMPLPHHSGVTTSEC